MTYQPRNPGYSTGPQPLQATARRPSVHPMRVVRAPASCRSTCAAPSSSSVFSPTWPASDRSSTSTPAWAPSVGRNSPRAVAGVLDHRRTDRRPPRRGRTGDPGKTYTPVVAVTAVLGLLLVIGQLIGRPSGVSVGWALWLVLLLTLLQAGAAVVALLVENGVITAPAPPAPLRRLRPPVRPGGYYGPPGRPAPGISPGHRLPHAVYPAGGCPPGACGQPDNSPETPPTASQPGATAAGAAAAARHTHPAAGGAFGSSPS